MDKALVQQQVALVRAVAAGDRRAFEQLYRQVSPLLFPVALRMLRRQALAEEVLHDSFLTVWNRAATYDPALSSPMTWLTHIVRNRCIDWLRSGAMQTSSLEEEFTDRTPEAYARGEDALHGHDEVDKLTLCLEHLNPEQRQSVVLAYYQGMSHGEIAAWLHQPLGTVKSWVRRALDHLKDCVGL
ncbi:MAG TPA: sigma-70 family RNA polymerase sigma factor [Buttiauxella sp.]|jgi:RNA polymerase sigma-70 factor (ECF subfamily)